MLPSRTLAAAALLAAAVARGHAAPARRGAPRPTAEVDARAFVATVEPLFVPVYTTSSKAGWTAATDVTPEHTGERTGADKAFAALTGSPFVIERSRALLATRAQLDEITARQIEKLLLWAAEAPGTIPDVVARRVEAEARQSAILDGYVFCRDGRPPAAGAPCARPISVGEIDRTLQRSRDLYERERVWSISKEIGRALKPGLAELQTLRNRVARGMGFSSYFALQVADYGMSVQEMMGLLDAAVETTRPLYDALHCFARGALAARYGKPLPKLLPAHWLPNRWGQEWPGLVEAVSLDPLLKAHSAEWVVKTAEQFYVSIGFPALPESFWKRSDLYPVPAGGPRKKNTHASAWHVDLGGDVRSLMSVEPDEQWFLTAHHELGHIYYFLEYSRPEVPPLLRAGASRAFHEAIGELAALAARQTPYLRRLGVVPSGKEPDTTAWLLQSALESVVLVPFSAGVMSHFEHDLYEKDLPPADWQKRWWDYVARFQGIAPPATRPSGLCDACTKTHINDDAARYYDYALATLIKFQLHDHICTRILKQDPRACDYAGSRQVGDFLRTILSLGATRDWRAVMREATGEEISPRAMMAFYQPLVEELARRNAGKNCAR